MLSVEDALGLADNPANLTEMLGYAVPVLAAEVRRLRRLMDPEPGVGPKQHEADAQAIRRDGHDAHQHDLAPHQHRRDGPGPRAREAPQGGATVTTHVIILAQGQQSRLPDLTVPKQMLELPACGDIAIIERTLCQLAMLCRCTCYRCAGDGGHHGVCVAPMVTVVCGGSMVVLVPMVGTEIVRKQTGVRLSIAGHQLPDPGNSSLKGVSRYLEVAYHGAAAGRWDDVRIGQTVVLLGDVVYSWACLRACLTPSHWQMGSLLRLGFVGTSDLSRSAGELWGLTWLTSSQTVMMETLKAALAKHPPFEGTYQPGQMRRWLWEIDELLGRDKLRNWYTAIDDYTRDIDLPDHVAMLPALSEQAAADDREHGLAWNPVT